MQFCHFSMSAGCNVSEGRDRLKPGTITAVSAPTCGVPIVALLLVVKERRVRSWRSLYGWAGVGLELLIQTGVLGYFEELVDTHGSEWVCVGVENGFGLFVCQLGLIGFGFCFVLCFLEHFFRLVLHFLGLIEQELSQVIWTSYLFANFFLAYEAAWLGMGSF